MWAKRWSKSAGSTGWWLVGFWLINGWPMAAYSNGSRLVVVQYQCLMFIMAGYFTMFYKSVSSCLPVKKTYHDGIYLSAAQFLWRLAGGNEGMNDPNILMPSNGHYGSFPNSTLSTSQFRFILRSNPVKLWPSPHHIWLWLAVGQMVKQAIESLCQAENSMGRWTLQSPLQHNVEHRSCGGPPRAQVPSQHIWLWVNINPF